MVDILVLMRQERGPSVKMSPHASLGVTTNLVGNKQKISK